MVEHGADDGAEGVVGMKDGFGGEHDGGDAFFGVFQGAAAQKGIPGEGVIEGIRNGGYDAGYVFESMQHIEEAGGETTD